MKKQESHMINEKEGNHWSQYYLSQNSEGNDGACNKITLLTKLIMRLECHISMSQQLKTKGTH